VVCGGLHVQVFSLVTFICATVWPEFVPLGGGWVQFVSMIAFILTTFLYMLYMFRLTAKLSELIPFKFAVSATRDDENLTFRIRTKHNIRSIHRRDTPSAGLPIMKTRQEIMELAGLFYCYFAHGTDAKYCDRRVCVSVIPLALLKNYMTKLHEIFLLSALKSHVQH